MSFDKFMNQKVSIQNTSSNLYLNGVTQNGSVELVSTTGGGYTGTHWLVLESEGSYVLECCGTEYHPDHLFLAGDSSTGVVSLGMTLITWQATEVDSDNNIYALQCFFKNGQDTYLNETPTNTASLIATSNPSNTYWRIAILP